MRFLSEEEANSEQDLHGDRDWEPDGQSRPGLWCQLEAGSNCELASCICQGLAAWLGQFPDLINPQSSNGKADDHLRVTVPFGLWLAPWKPVSFPPTEPRGEGDLAKRIEARLFP